MSIEHFISKTCGGERCLICGDPATHKVEEAIPHDEPPLYTLEFGDRKVPVSRHPLTAYVCCLHFQMIVGPAAPCASPAPRRAAEDAR